MQAAFLGRSLLPPPAAGARMFPRPDRARTGVAANGGIALVVQRVIGNVLGADYGPYLRVVPRRQGVVLLQAEGVVVLGLGQIDAGNGLIAMLAGEPGAVAGQDAAQGLYLADAATGLAQL